MFTEISEAGRMAGIDRIGKFQIVETLGAGAHSSILRIRREEDSREYALKLVSIDEEEDKKYLDQARHECRVGQMLDHPCVAKVYCLETESDWFFRVKKAKLLIEYVPGVTLDKAPLLKMTKLLRVFERVADGLVHMHSKGVFHADLKPGNIMLGRGVNAKIIDFGLARVQTDPPKDRIQGTPEYMAPETVLHKLINERTDIFNFGATMYRLATFKLPPQVAPMDGGPALDKQTYKAKFVGVHELNPVAPKELCKLIHRCLSYNALKRPERMSEVQGTLDKLADEYAAKEGPPEEE
jgi:eukaryotic-like serine/threonine-protein kinase